MNPNDKKMIGVIGGMGPQAGIDLLQKILNQTKASSDKEHLSINMISIPHTITDRTEYLTGKVDINPAEPISEVICTLYNQGATVIGMPCNTAHAKPIFDEIIERIPKEVKLVHMINEAADYIKKQFPSVIKVGILSTTGTYISNVYPDCLSQHGLNGIQVSEKIQENHISPAIYSKNYGIKAQSNPVTRQAKKDLLLGIEYLVTERVEAIILGCTEIPLALREDQIKGVPLIDATKVLARDLILEISQEKLIEENG